LGPFAFAGGARWVEVVIEPKSGPERTLQDWRRYGKEFRTDVWDEEREEHPTIECSSTLSLSLT